MSQFKVNYYLHKVKKEKEYYFIMISITWNKERVRTTLKMQIEQNLWDYKKQKAKSSSKNPRIINDKLDKLRNILRDFYEETELKLKRPPTVKEVKSLLDRVNSNKSPMSVRQASKNCKSFLDYFQCFIKDSETGVRLSNSGKKIGKSTITTYKVTKTHLSEFLALRKTELTFDEINDNFYSTLIKFFCSKNLSNNTQGKLIKIIKSFLSYMLEQGIHTNGKYIKSLKKFKEDTVKVVLSQAELEFVENLSGLTSHLQRIRDLFLVQIYTGLRFSDLYNLKPENINLNEKTITIYTIKTQDSLIIPIATKLFSIIENYNGTLPKISSQKYNVGIKEVCQLAGIDSNVQLTHYVGNKRIDEIKPKYELISSHTARRTFITLTLKKGILPEMLMKISGHKDRTSFQNYVRISQEEAVDAVRSVWD